jgi:hypothetical protein
MAYRNILLASAGALALSTLATSAFAASLNASAVSSVVVVSTTTLTKTQDMNFGTVVRPSGTSGNTTFILDTGDHVTKSGGDGSIVASTTTSAKFNLATVAALTNFTPSAVLTFAPAGLINVAAGTPLIGGSTTGTGPFGEAANGTVTLAYGGQFDVTSTTTPQTYTGTLQVTVTYN